MHVYPVTSCFLGRIASGICKLLQFVDVADVLVDRNAADTDADAVGLCVPVKTKGLNPATNGFRDSPRDLRWALPENDAKLVAAEAADDVIGANTVVQNFADRA